MNLAADRTDIEDMAALLLFIFCFNKGCVEWWFSEILSLYRKPLFFCRRIIETRSPFVSALIIPPQMAQFITLFNAPLSASYNSSTLFCIFVKYIKAMPPF